MSKHNQPPKYKDLLIRAVPGLHEAVLELINKEVPATGGGVRVLDWGAGQGSLSQRLIDTGYDVMAVDINDEFAATGASYQRVNFNDVKSVEQFIIKHTRSFDVVIGIEVIEHLENPWAYLRQLRDLVKPGGLLIVSTPNPCSWHSRLKFLYDGTYDEFNNTSQDGHINPITPWEMSLIMERIGLQNIEIFPAGQVYGQKKTVFQRTLELLSRLLNIFQVGCVDGYCYVAKARASSKAL